MAKKDDRPHDGISRGGESRGDGEERARDLARDLAHWRALTAGQDLSQTLTRLDQDELVALERRTLERMAAGAVMLELDRLLMAGAARLTYHADEYTGSQPLAVWVAAIVDRAIEDCLNEDAIEERDDRPVAADDPRYARLAAQLRTDARTFRRGAVVFHRMPHQDRAAFWAAFVERKSLEDHAREARISVQVAHRRLERAVRTFCSLGASRGPQDPRPGQEGLQ